MCRPAQGTCREEPGEAVHATRRADFTVRPYTARGQVHCGAVHGTGGQAHGGAVQRTIGWCVVGQRTEHVGKRMVELCMERGVRIPRPGRTQTGCKVHCGAVHGTGGYLHGGAMHGRGRDVRRGGRARDVKPCNGQEGSARRFRTRNRPANVRRSRARNERRRSRRGRVTDKREGCVGPTHGTGWQVPDGAVHATRREDCAARPYTARGQVHCGTVHGTGGQAHGGPCKGQ